MSLEVIYTCDLCGKTDSVSSTLNWPHGYTEIKVSWQRVTRIGMSCGDCTDKNRIPASGLNRYWQRIISFLKLGSDRMQNEI